MLGNLEMEQGRARGRFFVESGNLRPKSFNLIPPLDDNELARFEKMVKIEEGELSGRIDAPGVTMMKAALKTVFIPRIFLEVSVGR